MSTQINETLPTALDLATPKLNREMTAFEEQFLNMQRMANVFVKSGYFEGVRDIAQATVKIMAGQEMGMGPFQSMRDLHIIKGKVSMATIQYAARIKASREYDYTPLEATAKICRLQFTRNGQPLEPVVEFSITDATALGIAGNDNYKKQPATMLFWRAVTKGARMFCPHLIVGAPYTPEELGAVVGDSGDVAPFAGESPAPVESSINDKIAEKKAQRAAVTVKPEPTVEPATENEIREEDIAAEQEMAS